MGVQCSSLSNFIYYALYVFGDFASTTAFVTNQITTPMFMQKKDGDMFNFYVLRYADQQKNCTVLPPSRFKCHSSTAFTCPGSKHVAGI
jgi:hypothetical protein